MKQSSKLYGDLQATLQRIRGLNAEVEANQPIRRDWRLSDAENDENFRRCARLDQIIVEIGKANADSTRLRKEHANALEAERKPPGAGPSDALQVLYKQRDGIKRRIDTLRAARSENALAGAEGDKRAKVTLTKAVQDHEAAETELQNIELAIKAAEERDAEERREFAERAADAGFQAGVAATEPLVEWAFEADRIKDALAAHYGKLPALRTALMKSGANVNTEMSSRLFIKATNDRAAKAAGLHHMFNIDATVTAARLGDTFKSLLRAAVRRPDTKGKAA